jgi:hypothetical protein
MVLLSLALYWWVTPYGLYLTAFVGFNLIQSSLTGFCPAEMVFKKLFFSGKETGKESPVRV